MSRSGRPDAGRAHRRDRIRVRWTVLVVLVALAALLAVTTALERAAPRLATSAPVVEGLLPPLLDGPVRCTRADPAARIEDLRERLRPEGRLTSAIATACPRLLDGQRVVYVGEVVGDVLRRPGGAWVQVNDDAYALEIGPFGAHRERRGLSTGLAVWLPDGQHEALGPPGRYGRRGDVIRVDGVLRRADPEDGGGMTVRADRVTVLAPAVATEAPLDVTLVATSVAAALLALGAWAWKRRRARARER